MSYMWFFSLFLVSTALQHHPTVFKPKFTSEHVAKGALFRSIVLSEDKRTGFVGGKSSIVKVSLGDMIRKTSSSSVNVDMDWKPFFNNDITTNRTTWLSITEAYDPRLTSYQPLKDLYDKYSEYTLTNQDYGDLLIRTKLDKYLNHFTLRVPVSSDKGTSQIETAQMYATIYQLGESTYKEHCSLQVEALNNYYGENGLQMHLKSEECGMHIKGLTLMDGGKLFAVHTGIFGTMPMSATGTNRLDEWYALRLNTWKFVYNCVMSDFNYKDCKFSDLYGGKYMPYNQASYSGIITDPHNKSERIINKSSYLLPSQESFMGKTRNCDLRSGPNRMILSQDLESIHVEELKGDEEKEPCRTGLFARLFLSGYHPDQQTYTLYSQSGNGPSNAPAVYLITEIGQEKQLDLMVEYLNLPEMAPTTSSASLAMVRMLIDPATGDVDPQSITISNPFKYTWITSPLNRFGRLQKTASSEQVPYIPKPVGIFEGDSYVYFFFREADWETSSIPSYKIQREHFSLTSYSQSLYHPWEVDFLEKQNLKFKEWSPDQPMDTHEEVYNSPRTGWEHMVKNLRVTGRVARVCKNDAGIPMGGLDPNLYDLDFKLSLNTFQSYLKSKLVCRVPIAGVPFVWRLRKDEFRINDTGSCWDEISKAENLYSKDIHYRQVGSREHISIDYGRDPNDNTQVLFYFYMSTCRGYKWSYLPKPKTHSSLYREYSELRDIFVSGDEFYGVFSSEFSSEQDHTNDHNDHLKTMPSTAICSFKLDDIESAFNGPFKKRDKTTGMYRPHFPSKEGISPSPQHCTNDQEAKDFMRGVQNMTINFLDPTQPFEKESRLFDARPHSKRLNFLDEDIYGSRTMWNEVETTPIYTDSGVYYEKITGHQVGNTTILYATTNEGTIHKISTRKLLQTCWMTNGTKYFEWFNNTKGLSSIWDNEFFPYFNRTIEPDTFKTFLQSYMTMEKNTNFPDDILFESDWECSKSSETLVLAVFKPFGHIKTKIWDLKLAGNSLVLATDDKIVKIPVQQCSQYTSCLSCSVDPHCSWNAEQTKCGSYKETLISIYNLGELSTCPKIVEDVPGKPGDTLILESRLPSEASKQYMWLKNGAEVAFRTRHLMKLDDGSLIIKDFFDDDAALYELVHIKTGELTVSYNVAISECMDADCEYKMKYDKWCESYNQYLVDAQQWTDNYKDIGYCANLP